jgi:hypothetical protein
MPLAHFEHAVKATLSRKTSFEFMPETYMCPARGAMNGGITRNILRDAEVNRMALRTFQFTVELLCHGPASQFEPRFREDIVFVASFKRALSSTSNLIGQHSGTEIPSGSLSSLNSLSSG